MIIKPKCYNYNKMLLTTLHTIFTNRNEVTMVILLCYTSAFNEVIYADFCAKILDWNFRVVDENSRILVVVFVSKLNFSFSFRSSTKTAKSSSSSLWRKLIYFRQRKLSFSSSSTKKTLVWGLFMTRSTNPLIIIIIIIIIIVPTGP